MIRKHWEMLAVVLFVLMLGSLGVTFKKLPNYPAAPIKDSSLLVPGERCTLYGKEVMLFHIHRPNTYNVTATVLTPELTKIYDVQYRLLRECENGFGFGPTGGNVNQS